MDPGTSKGKRNMKTNETGSLKAALKAAGINAAVGHGRGTAAHWLHVYCGDLKDAISHASHECHRDRYNCLACEALAALEAEVNGQIMTTTGRKPRDVNPWDDSPNWEVLVYTQGRWSKKTHQEEAIANRGWLKSWLAAEIQKIEAKLAAFALATTPAEKTAALQWHAAPLEASTFDYGVEELKRRSVVLDYGIQELEAGRLAVSELPRN